jgi:cation diffusion facilitator CzcD-associated flavoprotein CzcO
MTVSVRTEPTEVDVAIVGGGFSGLGAAIRLKQRGNDDFIVLERHGEVGGTWHANTYPGCACDVPSHLYSFSFAPNPDWSNTYSPQPEIGAYLRRCVDDFGVRDKIRLRNEVTAGEWNDDGRRWELETSGGPVRARVVVGALGPLTEPKVPELPGLDRFEGATFHSARWDHDYELAGKRVASIGTGASAIQYVPAIQPLVERLHVFQRTPPWIVPHSSRPITAPERWLYRRLPAAQRALRGGIYVTRELLVLGFVKDPRLMKVVERVARRHMRRQISDPELRGRVTPDYRIGCKRILPSNRWYPALGQPNVDLVTAGIREVRPRSIVDADGIEREVDAIVFGTGFQVTDMPGAKALRGRDGQLLNDVWHGSPRAHLGATVPGFPNLFLLLGPNTGLGHSSMVYMIESQINYMLDALRVMEERGIDTVDVRPDTVERYNRELDARMSETVWSTGCASWYLDDTGRNATLWPDWTWRFRQRTAHFDATEYELTAPAPERIAVPA